MFLDYILLENTENNMSKNNLPLSTQQKVKKSLSSRYKKETLFRFFGLSALSAGIILLVEFFYSVLSQGVSAFSQTYISLEVDFSDNLVVKNNKIDSIDSNYDAIIRSALRERFPEVKNRQDRRELYKLISIGAVYQLIDHLDMSPGDIGYRKILSFPTSSDVDMYVKGNIDRKLDESKRPLTNNQMMWIDELLEKDEIKMKFNSALFSNGDSREPELAGIYSALKGSFFMLFITLIVSFPVGIAAAVYLEEFAPKNKISDLIEVNINNLAAVPSIVFGLLGLAVFINWFGIPRSSPLVGGLVLSLLTLPVIIISSRAAITAIPPSIKEAALGVGASHMQVVAHHILPLAFPGMLTGAIIGMSRALGESAPLLMIGMVAFIVDIPSGITDPSSALPVQIYLWADSPERAFAERTSAAIIVLLGFLFTMNLLAIYLRRKFERKW